MLTVISRHYSRIASNYISETEYFTACNKGAPYDVMRKGTRAAPTK